jgi:hypothetical protein
MTNWSADPCLPHDARSHKSSGNQKKPAGQGSNPCAPTFSTPLTYTSFGHSSRLIAAFAARADAHDVVDDDWF